MMCIIYVDEVVVYVRPVIQIVTNPLLIHYCILSTTYATNNYSVIIAEKTHRTLEIIGNSYKYTIIMLIISDRICDRVLIEYLLDVLTPLL